MISTALTYVALAVTMVVKKICKLSTSIFASTLATTLYVSSDTTILGILGTDYNVGLRCFFQSIFLVSRIVQYRRARKKLSTLAPTAANTVMPA